MCFFATTKKDDAQRSTWLRVLPGLIAGPAGDLLLEVSRGVPEFVQEEDVVFEPLPSTVVQQASFIARIEADNVRPVNDPQALHTRRLGLVTVCCKDNGAGLRSVHSDPLLVDDDSIDGMRLIIEKALDNDGLPTRDAIDAPGTILNAIEKRWIELAKVCCSAFPPLFFGSGEKLIILV